MSQPDDVNCPDGPARTIVRLLPLPNLVLFPHVLQPLHIFEARYRDLLRAAIADDHLIAMALLRPGWEHDYEGRPPVWPVACLSKVMIHHRVQGGAYNILLMGLKRVRLVEELPPKRPFREAVAEICEDYYPPECLTALPILHRRLQQALLRILPDLPEAEDQLDHLFGSEVSLAVLSDIISYMLDIDVQQKELLLAEPNVYRRTERLLEHLAVAAKDDALGNSGAALFPPEFSFN